jgi:hypothetical protein
VNTIDIYYIYICEYFYYHYCSTSAPWIASGKRRKLLNAQLLHPAHHGMKVPKDWPNLTRVFSKNYVHLRLSEVLAFCGDRGRYLIGLTDIRPDFKTLFVRLLTCAGQFIRHVKTAAQAAVAHVQMVDILTELEIKLPLYWCTITRHILLHMQYFVETFGSFRCWNMLPIERFHVLLKSMMNSTKKMLVSLDNSYQRYIISQEANVSDDVQRPTPMSARKSVSLIDVSCCFL